VTATERVQAVIDYGFTEREARFLILVMRHSGLCIKRQYAAFAGIANGGDRCNALFTKLVRRRFAVAIPCLHNRARLYRRAPPSRSITPSAKQTAATGAACRHAPLSSG